MLPTNALSMFGQQLYPVLHLLEMVVIVAIMITIALQVDLVPLTIFASGIIHNHLQVVTSLLQVHPQTSHSQLLILTTSYSRDLLVVEPDAVNKEIIAKLETVVELPVRLDLLSHQPRPSLLSERLILISMILR